MMENFAIDLDKVLDEFEKSEDSESLPPKKNLKDPIPRVYARQSSQQGFYINRYNLESHFDKLDLSAADFSASSSSLIVSSNNGNIPNISSEPICLSLPNSEILNSDKDEVLSVQLTDKGQNLDPEIQIKLHSKHSVTNGKVDKDETFDFLDFSPPESFNSVQTIVSSVDKDENISELPKTLEFLVENKDSNKTTVVGGFSNTDSNKATALEGFGMIGFTTLEDDQVNAADLEGYLHDLEDINFETKVTPVVNNQEMAKIHQGGARPKETNLSGLNSHKTLVRTKAEDEIKILPLENEAEKDEISAPEIEDTDEENFNDEETEEDCSVPTKLLRPTSLNLPAPLLITQTHPTPVLEESDGLEESVPTHLSPLPSPALSETDSALPPSPEGVSQTETLEANDSLVEEVIGEEVFPAQMESLSDDLETNSGFNFPVNALEAYVSDLTEDEQLLGKIKPFWVPDEEGPNCQHCDLKFNVLKRRHHCRGCGKILCAQCCSSKAPIPYLEGKEARVCALCLATLNKVAAVERLYSQGQSTETVNPLDSREEMPPSPTRSLGEQEQGLSDLPPSYENSLEGGSSSSWPPNPNNPSEYCSLISPIQQSQTYSARPPPVVMVPVGVLKRGDKPKREPKQVMFSDGIRPGGDLTDLTEFETEPKLPSKRNSSSRAQRRVMEINSPTAPLRSPQHPHHLREASPPGVSQNSSPAINRQRDKSKSRSSNRIIIYDQHGPLPPIVLPLPNLGFSVDDKPDATQLFQMLKDETACPVVFALTKNLFVSIKLVKLDCCLHKECWVFSSQGLASVGQDEVLVLLERIPDETLLPRDIFALFNALYDNATMGNPVVELGHLLFPEGILDSRDHGAFLFLRPTFQCLSRLQLPQPPYLVALLLQKWEVPWAKVFPLRLLLRIGAEFRYYPCPLVSVRFRRSVYGEVGHSIFCLLADFRNYQYTLPTIRGVMVCMEDKKTTVCFPRNRYNQLLRVVGNSNEHVLGLGAVFSLNADSHLVCVQDEDGNYQTQAINIQNTPRKVTGASFIVFSGALKSSSGLTAKSSIVEDGLLVQITAETMKALKNSFNDMHDFVIDCGPIDAVQPDEQVILKWTDPFTKFNIGVKSPIDGRSLEGIESLRIQSGTDYISDDIFLIRWTEVFFLASESANSRGEPTDPSKLADGVAQATCLALVNHLPQLAEAGLNKIGLRVTLDADKVGYEVGSKEEPIPALYMVDLDTALIPVITNASTNNVSDGGNLSLELIFYILKK